MTTKLIMGKIELAPGGERVVVPLAKKQEVSSHQKKVAALIAAAYLYKEEHSFESIERLKRAAEVL